ncbi:MAG TPA: chemotaxis protein CheC [Cytophagaceae bacterium]|jgi:chemotaxis protein CheC
MSNSILINDLEKEIIKEIVNIGLAKAADAFAIIAKEKVLINAPNLEIAEVTEMGQLMPNYDKHNLIIESSLKGDLQGKTYLLFTEEQADKFAEICLGTTKLNSEQKEHLKKSLLLEIGNIITGSLVTQLANIFKMELFGSVPELVNNVIGNVLNNLNKEYNVYKPFIFTVKTQFVYSWKSLELPFLLILDLNAFLKVVEIIRKYNSQDKSLLTTP